MTLTESYRKSSAVVTPDLGMPVDLVQVDLTQTWRILGEITERTDELITQLFSQFAWENNKDKFKNRNQTLWFFSVEVMSFYS